MNMKALTISLLAAGALTLGACGGGEANNAAAADNSANEVYNVAPDEGGNDSGLGNESSANASADSNAAADANASSGNSAGNVQ